MKIQQINENTKLPIGKDAKDGEVCRVKILKRNGKYSRPVIAVKYTARLDRNDIAYYHILSKIEIPKEHRSKAKFVKFNAVLADWTVGKTPCESKKKFIATYGKTRTYSSKDISQLIKLGFCKTRTQAKLELDQFKYLMKVPGYKERLDITVTNRIEHKRIEALARERKCSFQQAQRDESMKKPGFKESYVKELAKKSEAKKIKRKSYNLNLK